MTAPVSQQSLLPGGTAGGAIGIPARRDTQGAVRACDRAGWASPPADDVVELHFSRRGKGAEFEMEAEWVRRQLAPRRRLQPARSAGVGPILDIGCGIGALFPYIGSSRVVGVDYQSSGLTQTRRHFPNARLMCADASRLAFAGNTFAAITLQHVVEHLPDAAASCREWRRLLKPGGLLLVLTPNAEFRDPRVFDDPTHLHLFHGDDLPQLLTTAGFEVLDARTIGLPWLRHYQGVPGGWRLRRFILRRAVLLSSIPGWRWSGQTLCCVARRPTS